jgi:hypothetical protein
MLKKIVYHPLRWRSGEKARERGAGDNSFSAFPQKTNVSRIYHRAGDEAGHAWTTIMPLPYEKFVKRLPGSKRALSRRFEISVSPW